MPFGFILLTLNIRSYSCFENWVVYMILFIGFNLTSLITWLNLVLRNFCCRCDFFSLILILWVYSHGFTLVMRILPLTWFYPSVFNLVSLIIWFTLALRFWSSLWLYSSVFNLVNLIVWLTLTLRIWSSICLY